MPEQHFRLFLSSPSDVQLERDRAKAVIDRLNGEFEGVARIEILRWEDAFYTAVLPFQQAIDDAVARMSGTDVVVCIVWSRVGLKLDPARWQRPDNSHYESGTVFEFETACEVSRRQNGAPDVYLFRKSAEVLYHSARVEEEKEQHALLEAVFRRWTETEEGYNAAGYQRFRDTDSFEQQFESCMRQWLARRGIGVGGPVWDRTAKGSPFCGLEAFDVSHAPVFFGRDVVIEKILGKLRRAPFLLLIGASGSGKSSLLRAGLMSKITRPGMIPDIDAWRSAIVMPAGDPMLSLAEALCADQALGEELRELTFGTPQSLTRLLAAGWETSKGPIIGALARVAQRRADRMRYDSPRPARLLIAVDQVERLFVEASADKAEAFAAILRALVEEKVAYVIATLRSDAYGHFQRTQSLAALREGGATHDLLPPGNHEIEDIVERPVAACRPPLAFEVDGSGRSLAELLVEDARGGDALPLLQMTLQRLYQAQERRAREQNKEGLPPDTATDRPGLLRYADYPGMGAAVTRTAEDAFATLDEAAKGALAAMLLALVRDVELASESEQAAVAIVPVVREEFERGRPERAELVKAFISHRLLTAEESGGIVRVRPVHEALLRVWPEAVRIIREEAALIRVRFTLEPMVAEWARAARDAKHGYLVTSAALLAGAAQLVERLGDELTPSMRAFIADSLKSDAARRNAERNRQRKILAATAAGLVAAIVMGTFSAWQWRAAETAQRIAREQRNVSVAMNVEINDLVSFLSSNLRDRGLPIAVIRELLNRATALQNRLFASGNPTPDLLFSSAKAFNELVLAILEQGASGTAANLPMAIEFARRFEQIMAKLVEQDQTNQEWQYQLSLSHNRLGDVLDVGGRYQEALDEFGKSLKIRDALVASDAANPLWQEALAAVHTKIGDILQRTSQYHAALVAYDKGLAIRQRLVDENRTNTERQRELAVGYERKGRVRYWLKEYDQALDDFNKSLGIRKELTTDQSNVLWRRDLSVSYEGIGDTLRGMGRAEQALAAFQECFAIRQQLATEDSFNKRRQRDLSVVYGRIGSTQIVLGRRDEGIDALRKSLEIRERLARDDPDNALWQTDLVIALHALALAGDDPRTRLERAIEIARRLRDQGKLSPDQMGWVEALERELAKLPN